MMEAETEFFYRFRSTNALLDGWQELEKQEIYFAPPDDLNDPMEGFKDIFWSGDAIVWRNLIRHYLLFFTRKFMLVLVAGETYNEDLSKNIIFSSTTNHPSHQFQELYERICKEFFAVQGISKIPDLLAAFKHQIRREELKFYLRGLHGLAVTCICKLFRQHGLMAPSSSPGQSSDIVENGIESLLRVINESLKDHKDQERKSLGFLFQAAEHVNKNFGLMRYFQSTEMRDKIWQTAIVEFPDEYVRGLENLIFYKWYAACFVSDPHQAAMWGNYGDGHKGVCLKFRSSKDANASPCLKLHLVTGWSGGPRGTQKIYGDAKHEFLKMKYIDRFVEIDFFRSIGRITMPALNADWYRGAAGEKSSCADDFFLREEEWRKAYWNRFQAMTSAKLKDWEHEGEYRLVLHSVLEGFEDAVDRKLVYDFSDLEGIVFGIKTPLEDKKRIVDIIRQKCIESGRTAFDFGQAFYSVENGKIQIAKQNLLNLKNGVV